jgi:hypothetical protein
MFWGCFDGNTTNLPDNFRTIWKNAGVKSILGFNEPDNKGQSNLTPKQAATCWNHVDSFASTFDPPLQLVGCAIANLCNCFRAVELPPTGYAFAKTVTRSTVRQFRTKVIAAMRIFFFACVLAVTFSCG